MFENIGYFFKRIVRPEQKELGSKDAAKERLHLVLMQDRANVSADFLELMKQEIIDVIKKYIVVDESSIDVRLTNQSNDDGTTGAPSLYANIPIVNIKNDMMAEKVKEFEGVDFNKEMGITNSSKQDDVEESLKEEVTQDLEIEPLETETLEDNKTAIIENYIGENIEEESIIQSDDEEDDDDVTFDDLLKAAEQEDKEKEEQRRLEEIKEDNEDNKEDSIEENKDDKESDNSENKEEKEETKPKTKRKRKTVAKEKKETDTTND